ncbi:endolytic transglycosylase MltG [Enterococcus asini]|uniref:endolytic transglycosylase MltG n=1 Tax=Enterococcus asini TaxID=57732 RepID=UPI0028923EE5|nr:endolytic transglycosylase MltG [Enterococcus asini]MDT2756597.1 endolytic transglycosylase MltG [Enterococcus asini]
MSKQHPDEGDIRDKVMRAYKINRNEKPVESTDSKAKPKSKEATKKETTKSVGSRRSTSEPQTKQTVRKPATTKTTKSEKAVKPNKTTKPAATKATTKKTSQNSNQNKNLSQKELEENRRKSNREQENRVVSKIVTIVVIALLIIGSILGFSIYSYISSGLKPLDADNSKKITVEIPQGSSNKAIGEILEEDNVIKSGMVFNYYTKFNNLTGFQAGKYSLSPDMSLDEISDALVNGNGGAADVKVAIPEGYDVDQIGDAIEKNLKIKKEEFLALMEDETFFEELHKEYPQLLDSAAAAEGVRYRLEGYLFPATYDYYQGTDLKAFVTAMVDKTNSVMAPYYQTITDKGLTVQQVLTLASLVEKEGNNENDRRKIAQVFFNRLAVDMPIQSDISILYALGVHKELVTYEDLEVDSPYNLYANKGYGPGPFDNPSEQSIKAVLDPQSNDYYYFVADIDTGQVYYASTLEEHNALVEEHVNND